MLKELSKSKQAGYFYWNTGEIKANSIKPARGEKK